jgi:hypothetical protein
VAPFFFVVAAVVAVVISYPCLRLVAIGNHTNTQKIVNIFNTRIYPIVEAINLRTINV